jgi:hypothetical protein
MGDSPAAPPAGTFPASVPVAPKSGRRWKRIAPQWIPLLGAIAVAFLILVLVTVPVPHSFSFKVVTFAFWGEGPRTAGWANFPALSPGSRVSGTWYSEKGALVEFNITDDSGTVYSVNGTSGSFSFTSSGVWAQVLLFATQLGVNVSVTGTYWSPEWQI